MEAIGLVVGVAGLFSACLECLDLVDSARNYEHESEVLIAKLDIQRVRLQIWGDLVGLGSSQNAEDLELLGRQEFGVKRCLEGIRRTLTHSGDSDHEYGLVQVATVRGDACPVITTAPRNRIERLRHGIFSSLESVLASSSRRVPLGGRVKWAISDKQRFNLLVEDIKDFVDGLHGVVPAIQPRHKRLVERGIQSLGDPELLELVAEANSDDYPDWSETASVARSRREAPAISSRVAEWIQLEPDRSDQDDQNDVVFLAPGETQDSQHSGPISIMASSHVIVGHAHPDVHDGEHLAGRQYATTEEALQDLSKMVARLLENRASMSTVAEGRSAAGDSVSIARTKASASQEESLADTDAIAELVTSSTPGPLLKKGSKLEQRRPVAILESKRNLPQDDTTAPSPSSTLRDSFFDAWKDDNAGVEAKTPDEMHKIDPLGAQIWKLYHKTKRQLPNGERLENLTWRMMSMKLRGEELEGSVRL